VGPKNVEKKTVDVDPCGIPQVGNELVMKSEMTPEELREYIQTKMAAYH